MAETHVYDIPEELFVGVLLYFVDFNDVLRLRKVSRQMKHFADLHLLENKRSSDPFIEIDIRDGMNVSNPLKTLGDFVSLQRPFKVKGVAFLGKNVNRLWEAYSRSPEMTSFLEQNGNDIKCLFLEACSANGKCSTMMQFFSNFPELKNVEIKQLHYTCSTQSSTPTPVLGSGNTSACKLQRFSVRNISGCTIKEFTALLKVLNLSELEELSLPPFYEMDQENDVFQDLTNIVSTYSKNPSFRLRSVNLKNVGFGCVLHVDPNYDPAQVVCSFRLFTKLCNQNGVKLACVESRLCGFDACDLDENFANCCESVYLFSSCWFQMQFPYLQTVSIATSQLDFTPRNMNTFQNWSNLKAICLHFDTWDKKSTGADKEFLLLQWAFQTFKRPQLESVMINYHHKRGEPIPEALGNFCRRTLKSAHYEIDIVSCCPNITYLCLKSYNGPNDFFQKLWAGLPQLEYLEIIGCQNLGDEGFLGTGTNEIPIFCQIPRLKYFELTELCAMRRITNITLDKIIRHLPLKYLRLASDDVKRFQQKNFEEKILARPIERFKSACRTGYGTLIRTISTDAIANLANGELSETLEHLDLTMLCLLDACETGVELQSLGHSIFPRVRHLRKTKFIPFCQLFESTTYNLGKMGLQTVDEKLKGRSSKLV